LNHNIIFTNEKLHKIGRTESPLCVFCNNHIETLVHLFVECNKVNVLWNQVTNALLSPYGVDSLTSKDILLGIVLNNRQNGIINHIILEAKYYIFVCKQEESPPLYHRLKNRLRITEKIEKMIAFKKRKLTEHEYKWHHLTNYLMA